MHTAHPKDLKEPGYKDKVDIEKEKINSKKIRSDIKSKRADHKVPKNTEIF